jgi:very-short-patch-repair endonuclease
MNYMLPFRGRGYETDLKEKSLMIEYELKRKDSDTKSPKVIGSASSLLYRELKEKAIEMRENPTESERILWERISNNKIGYKFRRQHIISRFIVDFYCIEKNIAVELDGDIHGTQKERDTERDKILCSLGVNILRFKNESVLNNLDDVINIIRDCVG